MGDAVQENGRLGESEALKFAGKIMVVFLVAFFFIVVLIFCAHLYARRFWYRRDDGTTTTARRRQDLRRGLDAAVLNAIPIIAFDPKDFKEGLECSVCLSEVCEGEKTRLLPKCNHGFHVECIDMWFQSHSTCPLCRSTVANPTSEVVLQAPIVENPSVDVVPTEAPNLPTNVLFWGNETQVSTFGPCVEEGHREKSNSSMASTSSRPDGVASIDIPRRINEENELKSPVLTRLRSLKRLLSGNRRITSPSSPRNLDLEQGGRGQS